MDPDQHLTRSRLRQLGRLLLRASTRRKVENFSYIRWAEWREVRRLPCGATMAWRS
jgi:hypothetical protein